MRRWVPILILVSIGVLGGTFVATAFGPMSGETLAIVYIAYAVLLGLGMMWLIMFDPRASMSARDAAFLTAANKAADRLGAHRAGMDRGRPFRDARARFYRRGRVITPVLEEFLVDGDHQTRSLAANLLVARGPDVATWAEDRIDDLGDDDGTAPLRTELEKVVHMIRADAGTTKWDEAFL